MGISYILDIVIGLFFIYLILSLLASEIQELITTIFQWRAVHIKQSIEGLLLGNKEGQELANAKKLANAIYSNPLIEDLNQGAKGFLAKIPRLIGDLFGKNTEGVFGKDKTSGPSSINKQIFASSFLDTLQIPVITKYWAKLRLESFINNKINNQKSELNNKRIKLEKRESQLKDIVNNPLNELDNNEIRKSHQDLADVEVQKNQLQHKENKLSEIINLNHKILSEYDNDKLSFSDALNNIAIEASRIDSELFEFIFDDTLQDDTKTCGLSDYRKQSLLRELTPTFLEIIEIVSQISCYQDINVHEIYGKIYEDIQQKKETVTYEKVRDIITSADFQSQYLKEYTSKYPDISSYIGKSILIYMTIKELTKYIPDLPNIPHIPQHLERSLHNLAKQSQHNAQKFEAQLKNFQGEVENWYDNSMIRAKGVYKRNARLVALIIGFVIAIAANADTFHIVDRLSKDQVLRESVSSYAEEVRDKAKSDFEKTGKVSSTIKQDIDKKIKEEISLPLGWSKQNSTEERFSRHHVFSLFDEEEVKNDDKKSETIKKNDKKIETRYLFLFPKSILTVCGWIVSAIAISMGSSFWFDLLGKFIDIKNVGKKTPESSDANSSKTQ